MEMIRGSGRLWYKRLCSYQCGVSNYNINKHQKEFSTSPGTGRVKDKIKIESVAPDNIHTDWIGPPDPSSNLRPFKLHIPSNETSAEREFRRLREETHKWNQEFWAKHNRNFTKAKEDFIQAKLTELGETLPDGSQRKLTAEQLSEFYREFLDSNFELHSTYNKEWYKKNVSLLWPAMKAWLSRTFTR